MPAGYEINGELPTQFQLGTAQHGSDNSIHGAQFTQTGHSMSFHPPVDCHPFHDFQSVCQ